MTTEQLVVVVIASAAGAMVKSVTGMGYPLLAVPLIALFAGVENAVMVVAIPNVAANAYMCWETREAGPQTRDLGRLVTLGIFGSILGTLVLVSIPDEPLLIVLALTILAFVVQYFRRGDRELGAGFTRTWSPLVGFFAGCMQGATGVSGPVVASWLHGYRLSMRAYVHSVTLIFGVTGAVQLVILVANGGLTRDRSIAMVVAGLTVAVVLPIGVRVRNRLAGETFDRLVLSAILLSAVSLVFDAVT